MDEIWPPDRADRWYYREDRDADRTGIITSPALARITEPYEPEQRGGFFCSFANSNAGQTEEWLEDEEECLYLQERERRRKEKKKKKKRLREQGLLPPCGYDSDEPC